MARLHKNQTAYRVPSFAQSPIARHAFIADLKQWNLSSVLVTQMDK